MALLIQACAGHALAADQQTPSLSVAPPTATSLHPANTADLMTGPDVKVPPIKRVRPAKRNPSAAQKPATSGAKARKVSTSAAKDAEAAQPECRSGVTQVKNCPLSAAKAKANKVIKPKTNKPSSAKAGSKTSPAVVRTRTH